ncbi:SAM-dependent methyltransferases, partial [hydrothermal vent metagenome]
AQRTRLPKNVSVAHDLEGGRLNAPAAERNAPAITEMIRQHAAPTGKALEIASGTGQHVVAFAAALPGLAWQPTEIDAARRHSINAWAKQADLPNLHPAIALDATTPGWSRQHVGYDVMVLINLTHLISAPETQIIFNEVANTLAPGGRFFLYGPFLRDGVATSEGDKTFHASLRAKDPEIGYKDTGDIYDWLQIAGLDVVQMEEMPANNLMIISEAPQGKQ